MTKLAAYVTLFDEGGQRHSLEPGDDLPDWAEGKVGNHALEGAEEDDRTTVKQPKVNPDGGNDQLNTAALADLSGDGGDDGDADDSTEDDTATETEGTPDFTKPAPRTRNTKK